MAIGHTTGYETSTLKMTDRFTEDHMLWKGTMVLKDRALKHLDQNVSSVGDLVHKHKHKHWFIQAEWILSHILTTSQEKNKIKIAFPENITEQETQETCSTLLVIKSENQLFSPLNMRN